MKTIEKWNSTILVDNFSRDKKPDISEFVDSVEMQSIIDNIKEKFYLVLGWDWTMLRAIQLTYKDNIPYLGINFWSKWFLLNERWFKMKNWEIFKTIKYPLLEVDVDTWNWVLNHVAFNEVQVKTAGWSLIDLNMQIWQYSKIRLRWDWVIIVTPAGSTGYNISAWGPVLPHNSPNFIATPLLAFEPRNMKPIIFEHDKKVIITNNNERKYELSVYADSVPVIEKTSKDLIIRIKKYKQSVKLLIAQSYLETWNAKIFQEQWFEFEG